MIYLVGGTVLFAAGFLLGHQCQSLSFHRYYQMLKEHSCKVIICAFGTCGVLALLSTIFLCAQKYCLGVEKCLDSMFRFDLALVLFVILFHRIVRQPSSEHKFPTLLACFTAFLAYVPILIWNDLVLYSKWAENTDFVLLKSLCSSFFVAMIGLMMKGLIESDTKDKTYFYFIIGCAAIAGILLVRHALPGYADYAFPMLTGFVAASIGNGVYTKILKWERKGGEN